MGTQKLIGDLWRPGPIVVMGGAPCLPADLEGIEAETWLSANQHGHLYRPADFIVCADLTHQIHGERKDRQMAKYGIPTISPWLWSDYRMTVPHGARMNSGIFALYAAAQMGGHPVIATGFEMYQGKTYHHDPDAPATAIGKGRRYFEGILKQAAKYLDGIQVRAISGPLLDFFPRYDPDEELPDRRWPRWMEPRDEGTVVKLRRRLRLWRDIARPGAVVRLTRRERARAGRVDAPE